MLRLLPTPPAIIAAGAGRPADAPVAHHHPSCRATRWRFPSRTPPLMRRRWATGCATWPTSRKRCGCGRGGAPLHVPCSGANGVPGARTLPRSALLPSPLRKTYLSSTLVPHPHPTHTPLPPAGAAPRSAPWLLRRHPRLQQRVRQRCGGYRAGEPLTPLACPLATLPARPCLPHGLCINHTAPGAPGVRRPSF